MSFSKRMGIVPPRVVQINSMDSDLRNGLWNAFFLDSEERYGAFYGYLGEYSGRDFLRLLWSEHLKQPLQVLEGFAHADTTLQELVARYSKFSWNEVYDFVEFVAQNRRDDYFIAKCSKVLERELSPYRFVGKQLVLLTDEKQVEAVELAIASTEHGKLSGVSAHLRQAISSFSDRTAPDYRNSLKESISAVETAARVISGKTGATLSDALKALDDRVPIHPALKKGFLAIYGYTSDEDGIRHSIIDPAVTVEAEDARYMLVACSAFVGYLIEKASKAGVLPS